MARLSSSELDKVKEKYNVSKLYSYSMLNTFETSPYEYFLHYVLRKEPDRDASVYGAMGGSIHDIVQKLYDGDVEYDDMLDEFEDAWTMHVDVAAMKFNRYDEEQNEKLATRYKENIELFFKQHEKIETNVATEKFVVAKIGPYAMQGYVDAVTKMDDGTYLIVDWKSSSKYSKQGLKDHSMQLTTYAIALTQMGIKLEDIKCAFNMLKYCTITTLQKNGKTKERTCERRLLGDTLKNNAKMWLKEAGYGDDEVVEYLQQMVDYNTIDLLPEEVKAKYEVHDCWQYIPLNEKLVEYWEERIIATIKDINSREADYARNGNDKVFWDTEESIKKQEYYLSQLCDFSKGLHKPYAEYCDKIERKKNADVFGKLPWDDVDEDADETNKEKSNDNVATQDYISYDDVDLSWLDEVL